MDIYFAVMNFVLSGAIGLIGIFTLTKVSQPKEVLFALLPLFFAIHQFTEGFVWLGVGGHIPAYSTAFAAGIYIYYAHALLPFLIPLSIALIENSYKKKKILIILTILGLLLTVYSTYYIATTPSKVHIVNNTLYYYNPWTTNIYYATIYIITTCGALILSSSLAIELFGILNLIGLSLIFWWRPYGFTSLWCLYAAVISGLLYFYFVERRTKFLQELKDKKELFSQKMQLELEKLNSRKRKLIPK